MRLSPVVTIVMREIDLSLVSPTTTLSRLKPRAENMLMTRFSAPIVFSRRMVMTWRLFVCTSSGPIGCPAALRRMICCGVSLSSMFTSVVFLRRMPRDHFARCGTGRHHREDHFLSDDAEFHQNRPVVDFPCGLDNILHLLRRLRAQAHAVLRLGQLYKDRSRIGQDRPAEPGVMEQRLPLSQQHNVVLV